MFVFFSVCVFSQQLLEITAGLIEMFTKISLKKTFLFPSFSYDPTMRTTPNANFIFLI